VLRFKRPDSAQFEAGPFIQSRRTAGMNPYKFVRTIGLVCAFLPALLTAAPGPEKFEPFTGAKVGQVRDDNSLKIKLIWCPPGRFKMGSPKDQRGREPDENEVDVTLTTGFWLGMTELTQAQWQVVMGSKPWRGKDVNVKEGDDYPATYVSWDDAMAFCKKLTDQEKRNGRLPEHCHYTLPTEAEWEYSCRAGSTTRFSFGDDDSPPPRLRPKGLPEWILELSDYGWFREDQLGRAKTYAHPVAQKKPNPWGFFDMHGNVCEWCRDLYSKTLPGGNDPEVVKAPPDRGLAKLKAKFPHVEVESSPGGALRVYRSGSFVLPSLACRSAFRHRFDVSPRNSFTGFRVSLEVVK
jgi:formylglycine-generating enzyme required for sulfatase activity